jgi:hypothetical protein
MELNMVARRGGAGMFRLARQWLFEAAAQILENLLLALLNFEEDWFREPQVIFRRMNLASFQQDSPQVGYTLLSNQHLIIGLDHIISSSTIPRFRVLIGDSH